MSRLVARACTAHPKVSHQLSLVSSGLTSSSATSPATRTRALTDRWFALHRDARIHRRSLTAWGEAWEGRGSRTDASSLRMRKNQDGSVSPRANGGDEAELGRGMRADAYRCMRSPARHPRRRPSSQSGFQRRLRRERDEVIGRRKGQSSVITVRWQWRPTPGRSVWRREGNARKSMRPTAPPARDPYTRRRRVRSIAASHFASMLSSGGRVAIALGEVARSTSSIPV